jgi:hypothetical protein
VNACRLTKRNILAVRAAFAECYPVQVVGNRGHAELWVPAEELSQFNANIIGPITVIAAYPNGVDTPT